jgi:transcriptional regulator with XRE-family HTH domain
MTGQGASTVGASTVGARIRAIRRERGWSLREFEQHSRGQIKAITLGSYERGDRSLSVETMSLIAEILSVHPAELLSRQCQPISTDTTRHIYDLLKLRSLQVTPERELLLRFINEVAIHRGDWRGAVISVRQSDVANLTLIFALLPESKGEKDYFRRWVDHQGIRLEKS